ncbi:hypothetical protein K3555_09010 [Leisingera sp. M527]|uniref:hypothetical protein n=1 Tax=Leisingera sp. M527 TaxID=2867014 RepID=UPI0021A79697|nr:hypothetical protein [Leisingera sp. M527]UWQ34604.1 hypothetical protein K3555_09010 [Leisingera sp. M527]
MSIDIEEATESLEIFIKENPYSQLVAEEDQSVTIAKPWGDKTVALHVPSDMEAQAQLFQALNACTLPEKYSAIYHRDKQLLEVIWTAYRLTESSQVIVKRNFEFHFLGRVHQCWFAMSTEELMSIASSASPVTNSTSTNYRNMMSFMMLARDKERGGNTPSGRALSEPISFFIQLGDMPWEHLDRLIDNLNAYMSYYDTKAPQVLIHDPALSGYEARDRYLHGQFPEQIRGREIDVNALAYWREATLSSNEIVTFLTCYRIVEYLAFHFIEVQTKSKIRQLLSAPHALADLDETMKSVVEALSTKHATEDIPKAQHLVMATLDMKHLWCEVERHKDFFCTPTQFDGGYSVKPLITKKDELETFSNNGVRNTLDRLRGIRNALSHGQDQQTRSVIRPTVKNSHLIRPWLNLIEIIAGQAMLNNDVV